MRIRRTRRFSDTSYRAKEGAERRRISLDWPAMTPWSRVEANLGMRWMTQHGPPNAWAVGGCQAARRQGCESVRLQGCKAARTLSDQAAGSSGHRPTRLPQPPAARPPRPSPPNPPTHPLPPSSHRPSALRSIPDRVQIASTHSCDNRRRALFLRLCAAGRPRPVARLPTRVGRIS
jgi:hypothetical protein